MGTHITQKSDIYRIEIIDGKPILQHCGRSDYNKKAKNDKRYGLLTFYLSTFPNKENLEALCKLANDGRMDEFVDSLNLEDL